MAERSSKKQKTGVRSQKPQAEERIADPRFVNIQSDPRYRLPGKKNKVKVDKRFSRALEDEDFTRRAKVDRYGRPLASDAERNRLKRKYEFEDDEDKTDEPDADDEVQQELNKFEKPFDPLRDTRDDESSSEETTSDEESEEEEADLEEEVGIGPAEQADVPTGEVTSRIAIVNLDWDNIKAADLMAVFKSFLPSTGSLLNVAIYPSEFGKERLEREELEGPPKEIFANEARAEVDEDPEEDDEEDIKKSILQPDDGADFDSAALRKYQLERLRYYYCILTFSSADVAKHIYDAVDGTEYLRTANFFDLRFVPDDTDFSSDTPKEECERIPDDYKPNNFVTDALQHSKVKLTWDAEDGSRKEAVARAFKGGRKEIDENDVKAYLGSDTSDDEDEGDENEKGPASKKEEERQRMRSLLGLAPEPAKKSKKEKAPVGDMQVTFTSGLAAEKDGKKRRSVFENSPEPDETTVEKYIRKERERKLKRKERKVVDEDQDEQEPEPNDTADKDGDDLGFNDPFFVGGDGDDSDDAVEPSAKAERAASNKMRKEERLKKKAERQAEEEIERKQRAGLELLMADDDDANGVRHFDMKEIEKAEKQARKKGKKGKHDKKKATTGAGEVDDDFKVDTADPRFARLFESHEYAIDPTNPRFKGTKAMKTLLDEGRRRKHGSNEEDVPNTVGKDKEKTARPAKGDGDVKSLVEKIKRQTKK
ncbi:hypothetical protein EDD37DRAFT_183454 [Exophiala viscosa]|uniref:uncharacterized protein n=1 Tax=Exophiala viscosa TaxID=2486360 RepID=UPI00219E177B|nr:hypothetical protein EDD37DRAFT_183454 [Exophiala viscosa]